MPYRVQSTQDITMKMKDNVKEFKHVDILVHYFGHRFRSHIRNITSTEQVYEYVVQLLRIPREYCPPKIDLFNTSQHKWNQGIWELSVRSEDPSPLQWIYTPAINIKTEAVANGSEVHKENSTAQTTETQLDSRSDSCGAQFEERRLPSCPEDQFLITDEAIEWNHMSLSDYKKPGKRSIKIIFQMQDEKKTFVVRRNESVQPQSFIDQFCKFHKLNRKDLNIFSTEGIVYVEMKNHR